MNPHKLSLREPIADVSALPAGSAELGTSSSESLVEAIDSRLTLLSTGKCSRRAANVIVQAVQTLCISCSCRVSNGDLLQTNAARVKVIRTRDWAILKGSKHAA